MPVLLRWLEEMDPPWWSVPDEREPPTEPGGSTEARDDVRDTAGEEVVACAGDASTEP